MTKTYRLDMSEGEAKLLTALATVAACKLKGLVLSPGDAQAAANVVADNFSHMGKLMRLISALADTIE